MKFSLKSVLRLSSLILCMLIVPLTSYSSTEMPPFSLESATDGKIINSTQFKDKAILLNFFATWCPPCRAETPDFVKLQKEYRNKDFTIIGMSLDFGKMDELKKFINEFQVNYPVVMANDEVMQQYGGVYTIPTSFLVDKKGNVVKMYQGVVSHGTLVKDINSVLK